MYVNCLIYGVPFPFKTKEVEEDELLKIDPAEVLKFALNPGCTDKSFLISTEMAMDLVHRWVIHFYLHFNPKDLTMLISPF